VAVSEDGPVTIAVRDLVEAMAPLDELGRVRGELAVALAQTIDGGSRGLEGIAAVARELRATLGDLAGDDVDDDRWDKAIEALSRAE
jgi:hypothetical protein